MTKLLFADVARLARRNVELSGCRHSKGGYSALFWVFYCIFSPVYDIVT